MDLGKLAGETVLLGLMISAVWHVIVWIMTRGLTWLDEAFTGRKSG